MASAAICPVVGTTTTVLPPNHPSYDASNKDLVCPITAAKVGDHANITTHPSTSSSSGSAVINNAQSCPALKNANSSKSLTDATCPVVGPVSAVLPIGHPALDELEEGAVCPACNASFEHHKDKVQEHPKVKKGVCPVAHKTLEEAAA